MIEKNHASNNGAGPDTDPIETQEWLEAIDSVLKVQRSRSRHPGY